MFVNGNRARKSNGRNLQRVGGDSSQYVKVKKNHTLASTSTRMIGLSRLKVFLLLTLSLFAGLVAATWLATRNQKSPAKPPFVGVKVVTGPSIAFAVPPNSL